VKEKLSSTPPPQKGGRGAVVIFLDGPCVRVNKPPSKYKVKAKTILSWCHDKTTASAGQVENAKKKKNYPIYHILNMAITWTLNFPATIAVSVPMSLPQLMW